MTDNSAPNPASRPVAWAASSGLVAYETALAAMETRAGLIASGEAPELIWLLEHPPLYTAGTSARLDDLIDPGRFPVHRTGRGGQFTYHGPGQRVIYIMLDVRRRFGGDVRLLVTGIEDWLIAALARLGVSGFRIGGRTGVWTETARHAGASAAQPAKIAAIGLRVRRGVCFHGAALNVSPDLEHFTGIVPCGLPQSGTTSLAALGFELTLKDVDKLLREEFERLIGPSELASPPL